MPDLSIFLKGNDSRKYRIFLQQFMQKKGSEGHLEGKKRGEGMANRLQIVKALAHSRPISGGKRDLATTHAMRPQSEGRRPRQGIQRQA
jgi:hypothetical protein